MELSYGKLMRSCCRRYSVLVLNIVQLQLTSGWKNSEKLEVSWIRTRPELGPLTLVWSEKNLGFKGLMCYVLLGLLITWCEIYKWRAQNHSGLTHQTLHGFGSTWDLYYMQNVQICMKATKLSTLLQPYLLLVMYMTFQYLTVSCLPAVGHV